MAADHPMRHRLAHEDRAIAGTIVYDTVIEDLPLLGLRSSKCWSLILREV